MLELLADARPRGSQLGFGILSRMLRAAPRSSGLLSSPPRLRPEHAEHWQLGRTAGRATVTDALQSTTFRLYSSAATPVTGPRSPRHPASDAKSSFHKNWKRCEKLILQQPGNGR